MIVNADETTRALDEAAPGAVAEVKKFLYSSDNNAKKADLALKLLGRKNGNDSNNIKALALAFQIGKNVGLKGEAMRPLLVALNPSLASAQVLPESAGALAPAPATS